MDAGCLHLVAIDCHGETVVVDAGQILPDIPDVDVEIHWASDSARSWAAL